MPYRKFALKLLQKRQLERFRTPDGSTGLIKLQNEVNIMRTIFHPNVIILFEAIWECCDCNSGDDEIQIALITEYMNLGTLMHFSNNSYHTNPNIHMDSTIMLPRLVYQLFHGLDYLHTQHVLHSDIKPDNLLIMEENGEVLLRICDFGCARIVDDGVIDDDDELDCMMDGTSAFQPPTVNRHSSVFYSDIWAAGLCVFLMAFDGLFPFYLNVIDVQDSINSCDITNVLEGHRDGNNDDLVNFLLSVLTTVS